MFSDFAVEKNVLDLSHLCDNQRIESDVAAPSKKGGIHEFDDALREVKRFIAKFMKTENVKDDRFYGSRILREIK